MTRPFHFLGGRQRPPRPPKARRRFLLWMRSAACRTRSGYSLPEVMIASAILAAVVTSSVRMTSSSVLGMNRSKLHQQASSAMAARMETLRYEAFRYLCSQGCEHDQLTEERLYDIALLRPHCLAADLGSSFYSHLQQLESAPHQPFTVTDAEILVTPHFSPSGNQLLATLDAPGIPHTLTTTLVPSAQAWCP